MSTATARVYQPYFAGRFVPFEMQKSPQNKAFYGYRSTYSGKAHCIKDSVLLDPRYVSCVIQINTDDSFVSDSPYLQAFDGLNKVHHQMEENELKGAMQKIGYETGSRAEKELPNGKKLVQIDFARMKN